MPLRARCERTSRQPDRAPDSPLKNAVSWRATLRRGRIADATAPRNSRGRELTQRRPCDERILARVPPSFQRTAKRDCLAPPRQAIRTAPACAAIPTAGTGAWSDSFNGPFIVAHGAALPADAVLRHHRRADDRVSPGGATGARRSPARSFPRCAPRTAPHPPCPCCAAVWRVRRRHIVPPAFCGGPFGAACPWHAMEDML